MTDTYTIRVQRLEVERTGTNRSTGRPWTRYIVHATLPDGGPLPIGPLRTFDNLPTGEDIEVTAEPFRRNPTTDIEHYTLKRPGNGKPKQRATQRHPATPSPEQDARIAALEERVAKLERRLYEVIADDTADLSSIPGLES